jgi:two-component system, NarL family, nitrate/nitrite response regulator NarL
MNGDKKLKIKVFLVDDHPFVREGVRSCLVRNGQFEIVGEASTGQEAISKVKQFAPDVIIMDITMPGMNGLETTRCLHQSYPQARVLILTVHEKKEFVREAVQSGARGYIRKNTSPTELASAIERIHRGETFFMPEVAQAFFEDYVLRGGRMDEPSRRQLSARERQVLTLVVDGLANKEAADRLHLSVRTVEKHRQRIMKKLGIGKATELVKFAITRGLVDLTPAEKGA